MDDDARKKCLGRKKKLEWGMFADEGCESGLDGR